MLQFSLSRQNPKKIWPKPQRFMIWCEISSFVVSSFFGGLSFILRWTNAYNWGLDYVKRFISMLFEPQAMFWYGTLAEWRDRWKGPDHRRLLQNASAFSRVDKQKMTARRPLNDFLFWCKLYGRLILARGIVLNLSVHLSTWRFPFRQLAQFFP